MGQTESLQRLGDIKQELEGRLSDSGQFGLNESMRDELSELSLVDNHPADVASELFERGKDLGLKRMLESQLEAVNLAIQAVRDGTYGTCRDCGNPIGTERLEAYPLATQCVDCKRREEGQWVDLNRPVEELFLTPGYERTDLDDSDQTGFDGEDAWQAVARYNQQPGFDDNEQPHLERDYLDDNEGIVDPVDRISNETYRAQRP